MAREISTTKAQNRLLAMRLRELAMSYRMAGAGGGNPIAAMGAMMGRHGGLGAMPNFAGLANPPATSMSTLTGLASGVHNAARSAGVSGVGTSPQAAIALSQVSFQGKGVWPVGKLAIRGYLEEALDRMGIHGPQARANWIPGMMTIAEHESAYRTDAVNLSDSNAWGPRQVDGGPLHSTRGPWQVMPDTFARYHQPGTSNSIWDPMATACASMNYQMNRYGVAPDGHNHRALVGQANPGIRRGY
jgi:hypothetical protein